MIKVALGELHHPKGHDLGFTHVNREMHVNSDACSFQVALGECRNILQNYDNILFMHTKGISYSFANYGPVRPELSETIFNYDLARSRMSGHPNLLLCQRGHMVNSNGSIVECRNFAEKLGIIATTFNFAAGMTLFYAPTHLVLEFIQRTPEDFFDRNLVSSGYNRFFFEGLFPSILVMLGAIPAFCGGHELDARLSDSVSYDHRPKHNSAIVLREFTRRHQHGTGYHQAPIPYTFSTQENIYDFKVSFGI